ncbi:MAG: dTDP-4-dehydrorhamnose 3,5-epimerase [Pseudomonadota bacterium]
MPFCFEKLEIEDVVLVRAIALGDERGSFAETYKRSEFVAAGIGDVFVQDNLSRSVRGVLRGLHFQKNPMAQGKLVQVVGGEVFDVAVDIRKGSPTYGEWVGVVLSASNHLMLYVPPGFAHGFCVLSEEALVAYKATAEYSADCDGGVVWNDPDIGVVWPVENPILSPRDARHPPLRQADNNYEHLRPGA